MILASLFLFAAMSSSDAIVRVLNAPTSCGKRVYEEAREIVERDAADGKPLQQFVVGVTTDDKKLAAKYLDASRDKIRAMAEKSNNSLAWYLLSMEKNDFVALQKAADGGNVQALNALGSIAISEAVARQTSDTNKTERILKRSYQYFCRAARQRDPNGFVNLGTCYLRGFGCPQDMEMAFRCFKAAAELGHPEAMDNMSAAYQFGHGVPKSETKSLYWAMRARALRGDKAAAEWLRTRR
jgi:TPR repeat protein